MGFQGGVATKTPNTASMGSPDDSGLYSLLYLLTLTLHKFLSSGAFRAVFIGPHGDFYRMILVTLGEF